MQRLLACFILVAAATALAAAPATPGTLHVVKPQDGDHDLKVQPTDLVEIRIPNPAPPKGVQDLDVTAEADAVFVGAVKASDPKQAGSERINLVISLKAAARGGAVVYSYKDGDGKQHKGKLVIQVTK